MGCKCVFLYIFWSSVPFDESIFLLWQYRDVRMRTHLYIPLYILLSINTCILCLDLDLEMSLFGSLLTDP